MKYISKKYLQEKFDKVKWDMECTLDIYNDNTDISERQVDIVKDELKVLFDSILKELG